MAHPPKIAFVLLIALLVSTTTGCQQKNTTDSQEGKQQNATVAQTTDADFMTTSTGKRVRKPELGITVHFPDGWKKEDMDFHLNYCQQMMANVQEIDGQKFCHCFLEKIQYFYEPIYFREAYDHQQKWNSECFLNAKK